MRLKHFDYITLLKHSCNKKRETNSLSPLLAQSKPGNIRRECANVYQERYEKKDDPTLRAFFGPGEHGRKFLGIIQGFSVNRFKTLDQYLKNPDKKQLTDRNIELLAWLIDFKYRPYTFDKEVILTDEELAILANNGQNEPGIKPGEGNLKKTEGEPGMLFEKALSEQDREASEEPQIHIAALSETISEKKKPKPTLIIMLILVCCTAVIYTVWKSTETSNTVCAYWAGDRYQEIPCNEDPKGRLIITMNREKMQSFRKIIPKDTMTEWSIGKAHYIQNSDTIECFTEAGKYPENLTRNLRVLTRYMYIKHIESKRNPVKDSLAKPETKLIIDK